MSTPLIINDKITLPASDLEWTALPASKIELYFDFESSVALPDSAKARLRELAKKQLDAEGRVCIRSERTRDAMKNLAAAREELRALVLEALGEPAPKKAGAKKKSGAKKAGGKKKALAKKAGAKKKAGAAKKKAQAKKAGAKKAGAKKKALAKKAGAKKKAGRRR